MKINIPSDANELIHTLQNHGHSAYVIGVAIIYSLSAHFYNVFVGTI